MKARLADARRTVLQVLVVFGLGGLVESAFLPEPYGPWVMLLGGLLLVASLAILLGSTRGGVFPAWKEPLLDRDLNPLDAGTPEEWLAGRGALGGGAAGSASLKAAAVRAMWWEPEPKTAVSECSWSIDPDPSIPGLQRATKRSLRAARKALPGRGGVRVVAGLRPSPGPDQVTVRLVIRGQTDDVRAWARLAQEAFAASFESSLAGHTVRRL